VLTGQRGRVERFPDRESTPVRSRRSIPSGLQKEEWGDRGGHLGGGPARGDAGGSLPGRGQDTVPRKGLDGISGAAIATATSTRPQAARRALDADQAVATFAPWGQYVVERPSRTGATAPTRLRLVTDTLRNGGSGWEEGGPEVQLASED
jgi:hypothetical protein